MTNTITVEDHLRAFYADYGEDAWRAEVQRLVLDALRSDSEKLESFWRTFTKDFEWLDWEQLQSQAQSSAVPPRTERLIAETLKSQMPGLKSQAQYDAVVGTMASVQQLVNALLEMDSARELEARKALEVSLDTVRKVTELTLKIQEVPEAASSDAADQFKQAPAQFHEVEIQAALLQDLAEVRTLEALTSWYEVTSSKRDQIVSQSLRNGLLDAVRAKRRSMTRLG